MKKMIEQFKGSWISASGRCDLACLGCSMWERPAKEAIQVDKDICRKVKNNNINFQSKWLNVTGGNPLMNSYLPKILDHFKKKKHKVRLWTHGKMSQDFLEIVRPVIDECVLFIPNPNKKQYRLKTGSDNFENVLENLDWIKQLVSTKISFRVTPENIDWLPEIYELSFQKNIPLWILVNPKDNFTGNSLAFIKRYYRVKNVYVFEDTIYTEKWCHGFGSGILSPWQHTKNWLFNFFHAPI